MPTARRCYEPPALRIEEFRLGVFGEYGDVDDGSNLPFSATDPSGGKLRLE